MNLGKPEYWNLNFSYPERDSSHSFTYLSAEPYIMSVPMMNTLAGSWVTLTSPKERRIYEISAPDSKTS